MATMVPGDIGEFETEGEKTFYKFLEGVAKPDAHYLCGTFLKSMETNLIFCSTAKRLV